MGKEITILYGEMGSGKSYRAKMFAESFDMEFLEGDSLATPELIARVSEFRFLSRAVLDDFVHRALFEGIVVAAEKSERNLMVAQALYSRASRDRLQLQLEERGYKVYFHCVRTPIWRNFRQILTRPRGWRWALYWIMSKPFFQP